MPLETSERVSASTVGRFEACGRTLLSAGPAAIAVAGVWRNHFILAGYIFRQC